MDRIAIKERAKQLMKKNHWLCVGATFLSTLTLGGITSGGTSFNFSTTTETQSSTVPFEGEIPEIQPEIIFIALAILLIVFIFTNVAQVFVTNQLMVGGCRFFLKYRKNNPVDIAELFHSYKDKTFLNIAKVTFLRNLFIGLWSLLFIIPGIIKSFDYWAVDYILAVRPDTPYEKALDISKKMMYGHRMDVFELSLSFFGWQLLSIFTCGILSVCYVNPYQMIALTELYAEIREDAIKRGIVSPYDVPDYMDYQPQSPYYPYYSPNPQQSVYNTQPVNGYYYQPATQPVAPVQPGFPQGTYYPQPENIQQQPPQPQAVAYSQTQFVQPIPQYPQTPQYGAPVQMSQLSQEAFQPVEEAPQTTEKFNNPSEGIPIIPEAPDLPPEESQATPFTDIDTP